MGPVLVNALVTVLCALLVALPAILYARKGLLQGQANGAAQLATNATAVVAAERADAANVKTDLLLAGNEKIHQLVNSGSDVMKLEILGLKAEIVGLKEELAHARIQTTQLTETINGLLARVLRPAAPLRVAARARTRKSR
jgi:hypothetical protein